MNLKKCFTEGTDPKYVLRKAHALVAFLILIAGLCLLSDNHKQKGNDCVMMDKLFLKWKQEVDSEIMKPHSWGYTYGTGDIYAGLESLRALIHAPVSDLNWASYISEKIEENDPPVLYDGCYAGDGRYIYLSLGACERFGWSPWEIVAQVEPSHADPKGMMDTFRLHRLVTKRLKDMAGK